MSEDEFERYMELAQQNQESRDYMNPDMFDNPEYGEGKDWEI